MLTATTSEVKRASRYHHGDLESALVAAGVEQLREGGVESVSLRSAARRVGVSHAAPARHFSSTAAFQAKLAAYAYGELADRMEEASESSDEPLAAFQATGIEYIGFALEEPHLFRLLSHPSLPSKDEHPELAEAGARAFDVLVEGVSRAQGAGIVNETETAVLAAAAWSAVHGVATLVLDGRLPVDERSVEELAHSVTSVLYLGMRPMGEA